MDEKIVSIHGVWQAKKKITPLVQKTPLIYSRALSQLTQSDVYLKLENMHPTGSFKIRGAANKILSLTTEQKRIGVATFSTGNHGIAVAYLAKRLGIPAAICISNRVPEEKVNQLKKFGARIEVVGNSQDEAADYCYQLEKEQGVTVIKPFDDVDVISGQATIGTEIIEQLPNLGQVIIPLSGGGLLSGIGFFLKQSNSNINIVGTSIEGAAVMHHSLKAGKPIKLQETETLADSLLGGIGLHNQYTFQMTRDYMDQSLLVSEAAIAEGIRFMLREHKFVVEGAAAIGVGLLLEKKLKRSGPTVVIISGNNIDYKRLSQLVSE